jgi:hypothetical protein
LTAEDQGFGVRVSESRFQGQGLRVKLWEEDEGEEQTVLLQSAEKKTTQWGTEHELKNCKKEERYLPRRQQGDP